jgi:hypothetical protein
MKKVAAFLSENVVVKLMTWDWQKRIIPRMSTFLLSLIKRFYVDKNDEVSVICITQQRCIQRKWFLNLFNDSIQSVKENKHRGELCAGYCYLICQILFSNWYWLILCYSQCDHITWLLIILTLTDIGRFIQQIFTKIRVFLK